MCLTMIILLNLLLLYSVFETETISNDVYTNKN